MRSRLEILARQDAKTRENARKTRREGFHSLKKKKAEIEKQADFLADKHALGNVRHSPAEIHHLRSLAWAAAQSLADKREG